MILAIGAADKWHIEQMDTVSAYLSGTLNEEIYMDAQEGLSHRKAAIVRVIRSLYGLKQSGVVWCKKIEKTLNSLGLKRTEIDWSVFTNKDHSLIVEIYVDDLAITGPDMGKIEASKAAISSVYPVKDLEQIRFCLGLYIERDEAGNLTIGQSQYIENILRAYRMENCTPVSSPIEAYDSLVLE